MKPKGLKKLLRKTIPAKYPVLVKGAPGTGKTDIVTQVTEELEVGLEVSHPVIDDPVDYKGMPSKVEVEGENFAEFLPFGNLKRLLEADKPTVAFIDDMGQAPKTVQAALMQLVLGRRINEKKISDEIVFIAATNRRKDKAAVSGVLEPLKSRFVSIVELEVSLNDWCEWAFQNEVPPEVIAFIRFRPELLMDENPPTNEIVNRHSPRTVENAGKLYKEGITDYEILAGAAGEKWATEFTGFLEVWKEIPSIDQILLSPNEVEVPTKPSALYAISTALVHRVSETNFERVKQYAERMPEEYMVYTMRNAVVKAKTLTDTETFIKWASKHQYIFDGDEE